MTGGVPSSAMRRSTSTPATTLRQPSSQPPFGTESMWPPMSTARSDAPGSVNHWLPAASIDSIGAGARDEPAEPLARPLPGLRPGDALRAVLVPGELAKLLQLGDGSLRIERHGGSLVWLGTACTPRRVCDRFRRWPLAASSAEVLVFVLVLAGLWALWEGYRWLWDADRLDEAVPRRAT